METEETANDPSQLDARVKREIELLAYPEKQWVRPLCGQPDGTLDCAIVGGGQVGLSIACGLLREQITNIRVFDENSEGREGPWVTFARMVTLRTPKLYSGPENGIPSLTFRSWYEAQYGEEKWQDLFRIPREEWMRYLRWYRHILSIPVANNSPVTDLQFAGNGLFRLTVGNDRSARDVFARTVVIATGAAGVGTLFTPEVVAALPREKWRHTNEVFDLSIFSGKRVGILGAGASAFDNAAAAVEAGARSVDICFRRPGLPRQNPRRFLEFCGFLDHYRTLSDQDKWRTLTHLYSIGQPPPVPTYERAMGFREITLRPGCGWLGASMNDASEIEVRTASGTLVFDFIISATGVEIDLSRRPELKTIGGLFATWSDRYSPPSELHNPALLRLPYLGPNGQLLEKEPGSAPWLDRIFVMNRASTLSLGPTIASNSALRYATPMVVSGVSGELFRDGASDVLKELLEHEHNELVLT